MRSERGEIARGAVDLPQADLFGDGVGAWQGEAAHPGRGGEYLNNCAPANFSAPGRLSAPGEKKRNDPRLDELARIGLPGVWLRIAERVGFDTWLDLWRMLSEDDSVRHDGGSRLPKLRCFSAYFRFQRNQYIRALAAQGAPPLQIQASLRRQLGEELDITNVKRIARRNRIET